MPYDFDPWIDCCIGGYDGHLLSLSEWKECCDHGGFIDSDGIGSMVDTDFNFIEFSGRDPWIYPSDYTKNKIDIPESVAFILWFNK